MKKLTPAHAISALAAVALSTIPSGALAQDADSDAGRDAGRQSRYIEEVVVTVTKREESLQDVAASVSAISGNISEELGITDAESIGEMLPNVHVRNLNDITIRGISKGMLAASPVAMHENGVFLPIAPPGYYDVAAIEVLRGPAGTVYGRNATGGAMNIKWAEPIEELAAGADYTAGDINTRIGRAYLNVPVLGERLMLRAAGLKSERDGRFDNLLSPASEDPDALDNDMYRLYAKSHLSSAVTVSLRYISERVVRPFIASPRRETRESGVLERLGAQPLPVDDLSIVRSRLHELPKKPLQEMERIDGEIVWSLESLPLLGDIDINLILANGNETNVQPADLDGTEEPILELDNLIDRYAHSGEFRITSQNDGGFNWILGVFRADWGYDEFTQLDIRTLVDAGDILINALPVPIPDPLPPGSSEVVIDLDGLADRKHRNRASAIYVSGDLKLNHYWPSLPDIELFGGIRDNWDNVKLQGSFTVTTETGGVALLDNDSDFDEEFSFTTGELGGRWFLNDQSMLYLKAARGYKSGFAEQLADGRVNRVDPEILDAIEAGYKTELFDGGLRLNATAFFYDYQDLQVAQFVGTQIFTENASDSRISGAEIDLIALPADGLMVSFSVGYLDARFGAFCSQDTFRPQEQNDAGCGKEQGGPISLKGNRLPDSPELTASLVTQYDIFLGDWGRLSPSVKVSWKDAFYTRQFNLEEDRIDGYSKTDLRLRWVSASERYIVEVFVENLENEDQIFFRPIAYGIEGAMSGLNYHPARHSGVKIGVNL